MIHVNEKCFTSDSPLWKDHFWQQKKKKKKNNNNNNKLEKINSSKSVNSKKSLNILRSKKIYRLKMSQNIRNIFYIYFPTPKDIIQAQIKINIESAKTWLIA